jgi:Tfp pilus assembly protein PilV
MLRLPRKLRGPKGFCMAEVLISCLIAVTGIAAVLSSFLSGRLVSTSAKHWTQAANLARARIEQMKSLSYADLSSSPSASIEPDVVLDDRGNGIGVRCTRITTLTQQDDGITIAATITWKEKAAGSGFVTWNYQLRTWVNSPAAPAMGG